MCQSKIKHTVHVGSNPLGITITFQQQYIFRQIGTLHYYLFTYML